MTVEEFNERLKAIDPNLYVTQDFKEIYYANLEDPACGQPYLIYDIEDGESLSPSFEKSISRLVEEYKDSQSADYLANKDEGNPFKPFTNHLADVLKQKNDAYGDSFTKSVDQFGDTVIAIRLSDKFNRICSLIGKGELKENDESLQDTLLDMAGYSILALKYFKEHEDEQTD